jgi:hypothetical protein
MASKKEAPIRAIFDGVHDLSAEQVIDSQEFKRLLKEKTPKIIEDALKAGSVFATIFEINDSGCYIEIHRNDWVNALESCVAMYVEVEDYDTCGKITTLIQEVKEKIKRLSKK